METSSPLAAMQRPTAPFGRRERFTNLHLRLSPGKARGGGRGLGLGGHPGAGPFSIRDQLNQECFGPVHGSSPAGSLAADLCQNFTIGEDASSPRFPTPRRALFTSSHTAIDTRGFVKAPPLPVSSSPLPVEELMEMTPVPKKTASFVYEAAIPPSSPSPASPSPAPADEMMVESPCPGPAPTAVFEPFRPSLSSAFERRKLPRRASLTRAKGYSFAGPSGRMHSDNQLPFFHFGESRLPAAPSAGSSLSVSECFQESPPSAAAAQPLTDRRPQTSHSPSPNPAASLAPPAANGLGFMRSRPSMVSMSSASGSAASSRTGSPINGHHGHIRRQSSSFVRPRRQYRRSLSMFENPIDMMKPKRDEHPTASGAATGASALAPCMLASVMDTDESAPYEPALPHFFPEGQSDSIPRINRATLLRVLDGQFNNAFQNKLIIDCRFEYEYNGGHINEAINYNDKDLLARQLFQSPMEGHTLIVLHCEYSAHRAPLMARHIRAEDRAANVEHYPQLTYPELYILDGGYSGFFGEHPCRCYPQAYVEMDAAEHVFACERGMGRLKQTRKGGLHRAQTFAFGQRDQRDQRENAASGAADNTDAQRPFYQFNEVSSPTAPGRQSTSQASSPSMMMGASPILGCDRRHARRMASY